MMYINNYIFMLHIQLQLWEKNIGTADDIQYLRRNIYIEDGTLWNGPSERVI
jgi:hypothetical protein